MAEPVTPAARKPSWSTPLLLLSFALVFLILFNPNLRDLTGEWVGVVLTPLIGFGGRLPVLTIFLASVILVLATTVIRHFLVDWTAMARTQEAMRSFQKEFSEARKANNTYKMKKLTEAQPKVFELQAGLQKDQLKPMAFTMLIVIPLFAWLGHALVQPVGFELAEAPSEDVVVLAMSGNHVVDGFAASQALVGERVYVSSADAHAFALLPPGTSSASGSLVLENARTGAEFPVNLEGAAAIPASARVADLAPGAYTFSLVAPTAEQRLRLQEGEAIHDAREVLLVTVRDGAPQRVAVADEGGVSLQLAQGEDLYAVVPQRMTVGEAEGEQTLRVTGAASQDVALTPDNVVRVIPADAAPVYPYSAELPWQEPWSLQDFWWFLPHWILLYSLFGIPFGQIAQRALKLWEYRHVDLDGDGHKAGEA